MRKLLVLFVLACGAFAQDAAAPDPKQLVREGVALFDAGHFDEAIAKYKTALALDPSDGTATYELALAYAQKGDYKDCIATLQPVADAVRNPAEINRLVMLGNCLDSGGDRKKAIETYRKALKIAPDDPRVQFELGISLLVSGNAAEARELLKKDVTARPGHAMGRYALGLAFEQGGFRVPALLEFLHFLALDPGSPRAVQASTHMHGMLNTGVSKKDSKNINVQINPDEPKDEGDYTGMAFALAMASAAGQMDEEKAKLSEFERTRDQLESVIAMFTEMAEAKQHDYTAVTQKPFFDAMAKEKLTGVFAGIALAPLQLDGTKEWRAKNAAEIDRFEKWMAPQRTEKAAVEMPVPSK